jgi:hypothetical protein
MNIIELAKQAGFQDADWNYNKGLEKALKQFAALVEAAARADEREECWRTAENYDTGYEAAEAIRARGTT